MVDRVRTPYRVLLYQPGIRFSHRTNPKVSWLQQHLIIWDLEGNLGSLELSIFALSESTEDGVKWPLALAYML